MDVVVTESAQRHGVDPEDAKHAVRNTVRVHETTGYSIFVGPSRSGALLEVGASVSTEQVLVIFHAMPARRKFL